MYESCVIFFISVIISVFFKCDISIFDASNQKNGTKSLHLCSQYSLIWFVINLMTGFGTQINCGLNFIELSVSTIIY